MKTATVSIALMGLATLGACVNVSDKSTEVVAPSNGDFVLLERGETRERVAAIASAATYEERATRATVAATTVWEIAIKTRLGKLPDLHSPAFPTLAAMLHHHGFEPIPLDDQTAEQAAALPTLHKDPFDRVLIAIAQRTSRTILTKDHNIARYGVPVEW